MNKIALKRISFIILSVIMAVLFTCCTNDVREIPDEENSEQITETPSHTEEPLREVQIVENATLKLATKVYSSLNPLVTDSKDVLNFMKLVAEPLYELDEFKALKPILAKSSMVSADLKVWEIEIPTDVKFGNDIYLTASDVVSTYNFLLGNESNFSENVKNVAGVFEKDEKTVQFVLFEPDASFTEKLTAPVLYEKSVKTDEPIGTGLFKIAEQNTKMALLALNTVYRGQTKKPRIACVEITSYEKEYDKYTADFDLGFIYADNTAGFVVDGSKKCETYLGSTYYCAAVNTMPTYRISEIVNNEIKYLTFPNPCADANVRKAINYLISREEIINVTMAGNGKISLIPAFNGTPKRHQVYDDYENSTFLAGECLEASGYAKNEDGIWMDAQGNPLKIKILSLRSNAKLCEMMRKIRDIIEEFGITTEYESVFAAEYEEKIAARNYMLVGMETELNGFSDIEDFFFSTGKNNLAYWKNDKVDEYITKLKTISENDVYNAALAKIEETVYEESPILGFFIAYDTAIIGRDLYGVNPEKFYSDNIFADFCNWYIVEDKK